MSSPTGDFALADQRTIRRDQEPPRWQRALKTHGIFLVALALLFLVLAGLNQMQPWPALVGFVLLAALALALPDTGSPPEDAEPGPPSAAELQREPQMRALVDALPDPTLVLSTRSLVVHLNPPAAAQFPNVVAGNPIVFGLRQPALLSAIERAVMSGITQTIDLHQTVPNETWHRVTVAPVTGLDGAPGTYLVMTLHSLTEQKRAEAMRGDFIANASHELRTPLTSLIGFIDTLLGPAAKDSEARLRFLTIMRSQAERMSKLIDDLLSLSRIEMRQHVRPTGAVDLPALLREVAELLGPQLGDAGTTLRLDLPDGPVMVSGDREELFEVFENIMDNAVKYGGQNGAIEVSLAPTTKPGFAHLVTIIDHGPGVAEEHVPRLTERFYRVDAESSRKKKGTGLGLAIVKHIVSRHRGELTIRSRPGEGTRVEVALPR
jgi:two-component system phosphate regulon sensor histidine kinase PhoR